MTAVADVFGPEVVPLPTPSESAAADRAAGSDFSIPEHVLMETAGRAAAMVLDRLHPRGRIVGVAGSGNNGGDLIVMLRVLQGWGRDVLMITAGSAPPDASLAHGFEIPTIDAAAADDDARLALARADVIVDGMLGTGATGAPRGRVAEWIGRINEAGRPVLALDLPSGVDAGTGRVATHAVRADTTVCFGWPKIGLMLHPARSHCGRLVAVEIGFPNTSLETDAFAITPGVVARTFPKRAPDAHKGNAGRLLVLAGSDGMAGAAAITATAAVRAGAGLVRVASPAVNRDVLQVLVPEAIFMDAAALVRDDVDGVHALVAGPGLGTDAAAADILAAALALTGDRPVLLDADALNLVAAGTRMTLADIAGTRPVLITPHPGELHRLTGVAMDEILTDPVGAARDAAGRFGCVVLLKGQPSIVAGPEGRVFVNTTGSSDAATAGMGDQLAGTVGALLAGGCSPVDAATLGLFLAGRAADLADRGRALVPADVSASMHAAFDRPGASSSSLGLPFVTFDQPPRR